MTPLLRIVLQLCCIAGFVLVVGSLPLQCGGERVIFRSDPQFLHDNVHHLSGIMRGRLSLEVPGEEAEGAAQPRPLAALRVVVLARSTDGRLAIKRTVPVQPTGTFEVIGLPEGEATVLVQLGQGAEVWRAEGVACGRTAPVDPRLDPIRLEERLHWFELRLFDAEGAPASAGALVWREARSSGDVIGAFEGDAVVEGGVARFPATAPCIDVVPLVPGAATELFEGLYGGEEVHLGPGVHATFEVDGPRPDVARWDVRLALSPEALLPSIGYPEESLSQGAPLSRRVAPLEDGRCEFDLARGGSYATSWWVVSADEGREDSLRISGATVEVPAEPGHHRVRVTFPMEAFQGRRRPPR